MTSEAFTVIYNKALDLVSRREHSQYELIQKLNKRFPETMPIIEEGVKKLAVNNILNDERFAEMYLNSRARKGFGPKKIEMELNSMESIKNAVQSGLGAAFVSVSAISKELEGNPSPKEKISKDEEK